MKRSPLFLLFVFAALERAVPGGPASAQSPGSIWQVASEQKISARQGGFSGALSSEDQLGFATAALGDLDGDGLVELAAGAPLDDDGGANRGALWILFLNPDGTVKAEQKISATSGGFSGALANADQFGSASAALGDLDGDGVADLCVGAPGDDELDTNAGALWTLFLRAGGTVKSHQRLVNNSFDYYSYSFGAALGALGDLDGDQILDLAVGGDDGTGTAAILFLRADGTVGDSLRVAYDCGGFEGDLDYGDQFGFALAAPGDLDGDGLAELVVGAPGDDDGLVSGIDQGALWVLFLGRERIPPRIPVHKISALEGGFAGPLADGDFFGASPTPLGDLDGVGDLAVGAVGDDDGGPRRGAVWILFLNRDGSVKLQQKISDLAGGFTGVLWDMDYFGSSLAALGDVDGNGVADLAVGAIGDDDGPGSPNCITEYPYRGALWILLLNADGTVKTQRKISATEGGFVGPLENEDGFGWSLGTLGDTDGDGLVELAVGAYGDDDGGFQRGAVWLLSFDRDPGKERRAPSAGPRPGGTLTLPLGTARGPGFLPDDSTPSPSAIPIAVLGMRSLDRRSRPWPAGAGRRLVDPRSRLGVFVGRPGAREVELTIPDDLRLRGRTIYAQGALLDPGSARGLRFTPLVTIEVE